MKYAIPTLMLMLATTGCSSTRDGAATTSEPAALVALAQARTSDVAQTMTIYGEIERSGDTQIALTAPVEAVVEQIVVPAGAAVTAGQIVARLRPSPASREQLHTAQAEARAAELALARAERLRKDGLSSDAEVESARARSVAVSALNASLRERNSALMLRATVAGFVDSVAASPGDLVQPGTAIATLTRSDRTRARFGIDPARVSTLVTDMPIEIHPSDNSPSFTVPIASVSPLVSAQTRLASILADIPASRGLAAGLPLSAKVVTQASRQTVSVPYAALLDDGGQPFVFVVTKDIAHRHDVTVGAINGPTAAILSGVQEGDMVVTSGSTALEDGTKVRVQ